MQSGTQKTKFQLNKADINKIGFDLSSDKKLFEVLISPFEDDQSQPHPLRAAFPEGFNSFDFHLDKVTQKLSEEILFYMFYNIIEEKVQLHAGRLLMEKGFKYHKKHKVWVRKAEKQFKYFNINDWKNEDFNEEINDTDFYVREDFSQK